MIPLNIAAGASGPNRIAFTNVRAGLHAPMSLRQRTIRALAWSMSGSLAHHVVTLGTAVILARLLEPEDFGLVGMLALIFGLTSMMVDGGFITALVQRRSLDRELSSTVFFFNVGMGFYLALAVILGAPFIASFFQEPVLAPLASLLSITLIINALAVVQVAHLMRGLRFKALMAVNLSAVFISGGIGIGFALLGFGVWSLAAQQISNALVRTSMIWASNRWVPSLTFSWTRLGEVLGFGWRMASAGALHHVSVGLYLAVIGRIHSPADVGFYSRAVLLQQIPSQALGVSVGQVTFPVLSSIQDEIARVKAGVERSLATLAMLNAPAMFGLAAVAEPLVVAIFTDKWAPAIPLLQILCFVGLLSPLAMNNLGLFMALGRPDLFLRLDLIKAGLTVLNIVLTWRHGITAMVAGQVAVTAIVYFFGARHAGTLIGYGFWSQVKDVVPYFLAALVMATIVVAVDPMLPDDALLKLTAKALVGGAVYVVICYAFGFKAFRESLSAATAAMSSRFSL
jgi:teichuronic acid exporter